VKIVGICGSPRKGNTEWMLGTALDAAVGAGARTELLLLRSLDIRPCRGCLACERRDEAGRGVCVIDDGMKHVLPRLLAADVILIGTPGYMGLLSGLLKGFLDRTCPVWPALKGKGLSGITVAEEGAGAAMRNIRTYADLLHMRWLGGTAALAKLPRDASRQPALALRLARLGRRLAGGPA
jgi:multimeric flavodoxin WrbA